MHDCLSFCVVDLLVKLVSEYIAAVISCLLCASREDNMVFLARM